MKIKSTFLLLAGVCSPAFGFTLDFTGLGLAGTLVTDTSSLTVNVPGYGNVEFTTGAGQSAVVAGAPLFTDDALLFAAGDTIFIDFLGGPVENVGVAFIGSTPPDAPMYSIISPIQGSVADLVGDGAAIESITFDNASKIPEPGILLLTGAGAMSLLRRRR